MKEPARARHRGGDRLLLRLFPSPLIVLAAQVQQRVLGAALRAHGEVELGRLVPASVMPMFSVA